jgi:hypothetical protein
LRKGNTVNVKIKVAAAEPAAVERGPENKTYKNKLNL